MINYLKVVYNAVKTAFYIPEISKEDLLITLNYPLIALKLWCLNLVLYLSVIITGTVFTFLLGGGKLHYWEFTRAYFYDGYALNFIAWRIHTVVYGICLLISFKAE